MAPTRELTQLSDAELNQLIQTYQARMGAPRAQLASDTTPRAPRAPLASSGAPRAPLVGDNPPRATQSASGIVDTLNAQLGGLLKGKGQAFVNAGAKYGVDPKLLAAMSMFETGNGTSHMIRTKFNTAGMTSPRTGGYMSYGSIDQAIDAQGALLKRNYIDKGYNTIAKIGARWAPTGPDVKNDPNQTNASWPGMVSGFYKRMGGRGYNADEIRAEAKLEGSSPATGGDGAVAGFRGTTQGNLTTLTPIERSTLKPLTGKGELSNEDLLNHAHARLEDYVRARVTSGDRVTEKEGREMLGYYLKQATEENAPTSASSRPAQLSPVDRRPLENASPQYKLTPHYANLKAAADTEDQVSQMQKQGQLVSQQDAKQIYDRNLQLNLREQTDVAKIQPMDRATLASVAPGRYGKTAEDASLIARASTEDAVKQLQDAGVKVTEAEVKNIFNQELQRVQTGQSEAAKAQAKAAELKPLPDKVLASTSLYLSNYDQMKQVVQEHGNAWTQASPLAKTTGKLMPFEDANPAIRKYRDLVTSVAPDWAHGKMGLVGDINVASAEQAMKDAPTLQDTPAQARARGETFYKQLRENLVNNIKVYGDAHHDVAPLLSALTDLDNRIEKDRSLWNTGSNTLDTDHQKSAEHQTLVDRAIAQNPQMEAARVQQENQVAQAQQQLPPGGTPAPSSAPQVEPTATPQPQATSPMQMAAPAPAPMAPTIQPPDASRLTQDPDQEERKRRAILGFDLLGGT